MPGNKTKRGESQSSPSKILNRVRDLLVYTVNVTKPVHDKTITVKAAIHALKAVADESKADTRQRMIAEFSHSVRRTKAHGFPKSAIHTYICWIQKSALAIFSEARKANDLFPSGSAERRASIRRERIGIIDGMLAEILTLLDLVRLSETLSFISTRQMEHWTRLAVNVQVPLRIWRKNEREKLDKELAEIHRMQGRQ